MSGRPGLWDDWGARAVSALRWLADESRDGAREWPELLATGVPRESSLSTIHSYTDEFHAPNELPDWDDWR